MSVWLCVVCIAARYEEREKANRVCIHPTRQGAIKFEYMNRCMRNDKRSVRIKEEEEEAEEGKKKNTCQTRSIGL